MSPFGRERTSLALLLVLVAGLFAAGAAVANSPQPMACCPAGMDAAATGCTWLGAGDCCAERPIAPPPANATPPAAPATPALILPASAGAHAAAAACTGPARPLAQRSLVLRL
jgi:hypothetical protein